MIITYYGPFITILFAPDELSNRYTTVQLADGYSYERILIHHLENISELIPLQKVHDDSIITFPPVNCKSPSVLRLSITDKTKPAQIRLSIEKFGQIPDPHYFDRAFDPILVTGDDGNEYNVIPSDQFK